MSKNKVNNLIGRIRDGDKKAFREFDDEYGNKIMTAARYMTRSFSVADEIVTIVMVKVWRGDYENSDYYINKFVWELTKCSVLEYMGDYRNTLAYDKEREIAATNDMTEQDRAMDRILWRFDDKDREIILRRMLFDYTFEEIADDMRISVSETQERYQCVMNMMKEKIKLKGDDA